MDYAYKRLAFLSLSTNIMHSSARFSTQLSAVKSFLTCISTKMDLFNCYVPRKFPILHLWCATSTALLIYLFFQVKGSESVATTDFQTIKVRRIPNSSVEPIGTNNIFFLETRSPANRVSTLHPRQACSIESMSRANPDWDLFLYITDVDYYKVDELWTIVRMLPNVHIKPIDPVEFARGTLVEPLLLQGIKSKDEWRVPHISDILRYTILSKYAGVYSDLDVIALKPFKRLGTNFVAQEGMDMSLLTIGSAIVSFGDDEVGRKLAKMVLEDVANNFTGLIWVESIASLTRSIMRLCNTQIVSEATPENCDGFNVLPKESFYAIPFFENDVFFDELAFLEGYRRLNSSVVSHLWNHLSKKKKVSKSKKTLINFLGWKHCPEVFSAVDNHL